MNSPMSAESFAKTILHLALKTEDVTDKDIRRAFELSFFSRDKVSLVRDELSAYKAFLLNWAAAVAFESGTYERIHDEYASILREKSDQHRTLYRIATNWVGYWNLFIEMQNGSPTGEIQWDKFHLKAASLFVDNVEIGHPMGIAPILLTMTGAAMAIVPINRDTEIIT